MKRRGAKPFDAVRTLLSLTEADRIRLLAGLSEPERRELDQRWTAWAHARQLAPDDEAWRVWLIRAGRGFGKTRAGAEWVSQYARDHGDARIALVGASKTEAEAVMIHGMSGVIAIARADERPSWHPSTSEVHFASGAIARVYSAGAPEGLRGPEHHAAWCDELAKWPRGPATWDNLLMTMRLGDRPRVVVTTTPRPTALMRRIIAAPGTVDAVGRTWENPHLPPDYEARMRLLYGNTRLGRQELEGELLEDHEGALWTRGMIEACRLEGATPAFRRVVVAVDPPASAEGDACGIVCVALGADGVGYVLEDASVQGASPAGWAAAVADCAGRWGADRVVAEKNQGGEMVGHVLRGADRALPVRLVHASRGKLARAEPVAALYEQVRFARVTSVADAVVTVDAIEPAANAYGNGRVRWLGGPNAGLASRVASSAGAVLTLEEPPPFRLAPGVLVELTEGCDKSVATCAGRFGNAANFRGEPYLPGIDLLTRYPGE